EQRQQRVQRLELEHLGQYQCELEQRHSLLFEDPYEGPNTNSQPVVLVHVRRSKRGADRPEPDARLDQETRPHRQHDESGRVVGGGDGLQDEFWLDQLQIKLTYRPAGALRPLGGCSTTRIGVSPGTILPPDPNANPAALAPPAAAAYDWLDADWGPNPDTGP